VTKATLASQALCQPSHSLHHACPQPPSSNPVASSQIRSPDADHRHQIRPPTLRGGGRGKLPRSPWPPRRSASQPPHRLHRACTQPPSLDPASWRRHQREARAHRVALPTEHEAVAGGKPRPDPHDHRPSVVNRLPPLAQHESRPQTPQRYAMRESPAATILAIPSGSAEGLAPAVARWREGEEVAEGGGRGVARVTRSRVSGRRERN
jgi:hypothetical protein